MSLEWFFQLPGLFITGGIVLILIALLVFILGTGILSFIDPDTSSVIALVLAIVILMILALASLKIAFLIVSSVIANFIIADYSNKTAKEIKKKAVYILSH